MLTVPRIYHTGQRKCKCTA